MINSKQTWHKAFYQHPFPRHNKSKNVLKIFKNHFLKRQAISVKVYFKKSSVSDGYTPFKGEITIKMQI
jgi:hypothetical protein